MKIIGFLKDKLTISILEILTVIILVGILFFSFLYSRLTEEGFKETPNKSTQSKQATTSAKKNPNTFSLINTITGKIIQIDKQNRIVTLETIDEKKRKFKVKIPENIVMSRPIPLREGEDPKTTNYPPIVEKFENLRIGSVLSVLSKEDPNLTTDLTAIQIGVLV